jgi:hypothetical protein
MFPRFDCADWTELGKNWPASGMIVDGVLCPLSTWGRRTKETAGFSLPTPTAADYGTGGNGVRKGKQKQIISLGTMARHNLWPTPVADDAVNRVQGKWNSRGEPKLSAAVMLWPTPVASTNRKSTKAMTPSTGNGRRSGGGNSSPPGLEQAVEISMGQVPKELEAILHHPQVQEYLTLWPTPQAHDGKGPPGKGTRERGGRGADLQVAAGGKLNPTWVEWLMGYPSEWTVCTPSAMAWYRSASRKRSKG